MKNPGPKVAPLGDETYLRVVSQGFTDPKYIITIGCH